MIRLYQADERSYTANNGDVILKPILALVRCEDNGAFTLDLETDLTYADWLVQDAIVVVPTPDGDQPFRLNNPVKTGRKIKIKAKHVSYDAERLLIADSYVVSKNCQEAMQHLNAATDATSPFTMSSDITAVNSYRCVRKSLWEALKVVLERWGGHLKRDGFTISILSSLEKDNGAVIRTGKNLKELTQTENWDNVCTKLLPVGKDGTLRVIAVMDAELQVALPGVLCSHSHGRQHHRANAIFIQSKLSGIHCRENRQSRKPHYCGNVFVKDISSVAHCQLLP